MEKDLKNYIEQAGIDQFFNKDMSNHMVLTHYKKGDHLLYSDDLMTHFYFIVEGQIKIYKQLENGKSVLIRLPKAVTELGSLEFASDNRWVDSCVQALTPVVAIKISFEALEKECQADIVFYKYLVKGLSHKLRTASNTASINITYPFKNRLASYLISIAQASPDSSIDDIKIKTMTDLAHFLGTSYRHLNRVVQDLENEKIILKEKRKIKILDFDRLKSLSGGYYE
jgi:CRP-like cAMP-binding protein